MADTSVARGLGTLRMAVGVTMLAAPRLVGRNDDPSFQLLLRTIGVRDLVLGAGTVLAPDADLTRWATTALASDLTDVVVGAASIRTVGRQGGLVAALAPVPFVAAGLVGIRRARDRHAARGQ